HPAYLRLVPTEGDDRERYNVFALVKGAKKPKKETIILMGHMDTVGIEDYGKWKSLAFSPDALAERLRHGKVKESVRKDLESGEWMFGRGSVDMKSGVASHLALIRHFASQPNSLNGNVLLLVECDEEEDSHGILSALKDLQYLAQKEN